VIADVNLPRLSGVELFQKLRATDANVKMIFATGEEIDGALGALEKEPGVLVVKKPYDLDDILQAVKRALGPSTSV